MTTLLIPILAFAIIAGQLIKLPLLNQGGATTLDIAVISLSLIGLFKLKFKLKNPPLFLKCAGIFIFVAILSLILTPLHLKHQQYFISFLYTIRFSFYILFGWIIYSGAFPSIKNRAPSILIFSGVILAILGLLQLIFIPDLRFLTAEGWDPHYFRTVSTFLDPNFLGGFFALTLLLQLSLRGPHPWRGTWQSNLYFTLVYLALLTTFSRGAYLAFISGFSVYSYLNKSIKLGIIALVLSAGLFYGYANYQRSVAAPRNIDRTQSAGFRFNSWQQGGALFQQAPILGAGFNSYKYALSEHHLAGSDFLNTHGSSTNDSSLLYVASTTGTLGLFAYLLFLATSLQFAWRSFKNKNIYGAIFIAALIGSTIQSFFANTLFYPFILIWLILASTKLSE